MWIDQQPLIIYTLVDGSGSYGQFRCHFRTGTEAVAAHTGADARRGLLAAVTGCAIVEQMALYGSVQSTPGAPDPDSDGACAGTFVFSTNAIDQYALLALPAIRPDMLMAAGCGAELDIDRTRPEIIALVDHILTGPFSNRFGYPIAALLAAYLQERRIDARLRIS